MSTQFSQPAETKHLATVAKNMTQRGFTAEVVATAEDALKKIQALIPEKASVMTGSSTTLQQIGFTQLLEENTKHWKNLSAEIWAEENEEKRENLRRLSTTAEYFLASANAVTKNGVIVAVDASGSRVGALPYSAEHVILVVGAQKITPTLETAFQRIKEYVFPKEDKRAQEAYGVNSSMNKWVILEGDKPGRITVIFVEEVLGF